MAYLNGRKILTVVQVVGGGGTEDLDNLIKRTITTISNDNVTYVGDYAFKDCTSLTSATFPNATQVRQNAFEGCSSLANFDFTNIYNIYTQAFKDCTSLSFILDDATFTKINSVGIGGLQNTAITSINSTKLANINSSAFMDCTSLTSVTISMSGGAIDIKSSAFYNCTSLTTVNLSECYFSSSVFYGCTNLTTVTIDSVNTINQYTFYNCTNLQTITLKKQSVVTLSNINAFTGVNGTVTIYVPSNLVDSYKAATNWVTLYNNNKVNFLAIPS